MRCEMHIDLLVRMRPRALWARRRPSVLTATPRVIAAARVVIAAALICLPVWRRRVSSPWGSRCAQGAILRRKMHVATRRRSSSSGGEVAGRGRWA